MSAAGTTLICLLAILVAVQGYTVFVIGAGVIAFIAHLIKISKE